MTTFSFSGVRVDFVDGDADAGKTIEADITVPSATSTFSYQITGRDDGIAIIDMDDEVLQPIFDGFHLDYPDFEVRSEETLITEVNWKSGGSSVILIISMVTGDDTDTEFYFVLDGKAFPAINSAEDWQAVDADIASLTDPDGDFAPGQDIAWADIPGTTSTEEDDFWGTPGKDKFKGGTGDDYFSSSEGNDTLDGGAGGYDQVSFANDPDAVVANLISGKATDGWGNTDRLKSIEMLRGSAYDDKFTGNGKANIFRGLAGDDTLNGGKGTDQIRYDRDARYGGEDGVTVRLDKGYAIDGFGDRDTLKSIENVRGSDAADKITGNSGKNRLEGEAGKDVLLGKGGKDTIYGGDGRDTLDGGGSDDYLTGGADADRFVFSGSFGDDVIADFQTAGRKEKIDLSDVTTIKNFRDLKNNHLSENDNGDAVISDKKGNSITLEDVAIADLSFGDFIF